MLFKIPLESVRGSDLFSATFKLPSGLHADEPGMSDDNPIELDGVKKEDLRGFLKVRCQMCVATLLADSSR